MNAFRLKAHNRPARRVYSSLAAQWDNLGDIEIRQTVVDWISSTKSEMTLFVGQMPNSYLEAFELPESVRLVRNPGIFQTQLWSDIARRRAHIVFAPGPQGFRLKIAPMVKTLVNLMNVLGVRISGGHAVAVGRSLRGTGLLPRILEILFIRSFDSFVVRDSVSASVLRIPLRAAPDLAFGNAPIDSPINERRLVSISLRGDRPIQREGLSEVVDELVAQGFEPVFVTQVKRDDERHKSLGSVLGVRCLAWNDRSHADQLREVRAAYAASAYVVSNRLHSLILGAQGGALPVAIMDGGSDKLSATLDAWIRLIKIDIGAHETADLMRIDIPEAQLTLSQELDHARGELGKIQREVTHLLGVESI